MKLMISNTDGRILNVGERPFANEAALSNFSVVDVGNLRLPAIDWQNYRYVSGAFVRDPLPASAADLAKAALKAMDWQTKITTIAAGRAAVAAINTDATWLAARPRIVAVLDGIINEAEANLKRWRTLLQTLAMTDDKTP